MSEFTIPIVDLRDYVEGSNQQQQTFVQTIGEALRDVGFFALTNHGLDEELTRKAYTISETFYRLPDETKTAYITGQGGQRGFTSFGTEHAKDQSAPDLKEFWHVGRELEKNHRLYDEYPKNIWPNEIAEFRPTMLEVYRRLDHCSMALLEACSLFIGEPKELFSSIAKDGNTILRLIHYPPVPDDAHPSSIRAAAHEDINLITLLIDATASGLELQRRDGSWMPVVTPKGCIIVDAGDMLQNITNGYFRSTTHRVVNPDNSRERRFSMPFFVHPRSEVNLDPLPSCVAKTGGKSNYPNITAGAYLNQRLREIGLA